MNHALAWTHASNPRDIVGYMASALVLAAFSVRSMRTLRMTAIASNLAFIAYAALGNMLPILILHGILLPMNIVRLTQIDSDGPGVHPKAKPRAYSRATSGRPVD